ncbi:MAG: sulfite exporter TauE/SafE family protein [Chloroflexaceae bacterium]|nr:sulfite exporter TauE/SafE family protein [Chloroflexaceae bacterium]
MITFVLFGVALLAGALNAVAGGGSFFTFPALIFAGVPPILANATNATALWPGSIASTIAYRQELLAAPRQLTILLCVTSLLGGILGALALLGTPPELFSQMVPFLLLIATLLFAFRQQVVRLVQGQSVTATPSRLALGIVVFLNLLISIYGGFFGGGMGIMGLAVLSLLGLDSIHTMNGLKTLVFNFSKGIAVITFVVASVVVWPYALVMTIGAIAGGYFGAAYARKADPRLVHYLILVVGFGMSAIFFVRAYL